MGDLKAGQRLAGAVIKYLSADRGTAFEYEVDTGVTQFDLFPVLVGVVVVIDTYGIDTLR